MAHGVYWLHISWARSHLATEAFASASSTSNQWPSFVTLEWWSTLSSRCAFTCHEQRICFYHLRRLRSIRRQLGRDVTARLVSAFVLSRLDYCNAVLAGLPASTLAPFQRVLHAAARLVLNLRPRDHVSAALGELHWLPVAQQAVHVSPQVIAWSSAGVHHQHVEGSCWRPVIDHVAHGSKRELRSPPYQPSVGWKSIFRRRCQSLEHSTNWPQDSYLFNGHLQTSFKDLPFQKGLRLTFTLLLVKLFISVMRHRSLLLL